MQAVTSGRTVQWFDLIQKLFVSGSAEGAFFGYGVGHYSWQSLHGFEVEVHNMPLQALYDFGVVLSVFLLIFLLYNFFRLMKLPSEDREIATIQSIALVLLLTSCVQGLVLSTQSGWVIAAFTAFICVTLKRNGARMKNT